MTAQIQPIVTALREFAPDASGDNVSSLYRLLDGFNALPERECAIPSMFELIERFPEADLGSPGPLVHEIEAIAGYEEELRASLARTPTLLTVWMLNRILNATRSEKGRASWLALLREVASSPRAPESARGEARNFLEFQGAK